MSLEANSVHQVFLPPLSRIGPLHHIFNSIFVSTLKTRNKNTHLHNQARDDDFDTDRTLQVLMRSHSLDLISRHIEAAYTTANSLPSRLDPSLGDPMYIPPRPAHAHGITCGDFDNEVKDVGVRGG